jgi:hypothetical protein
MTSRSIRIHAVAVLVLLAVQFLAGMLLNLFVALPKTRPGSSGDNYLVRSWTTLVWAFSGGGGWTLTTHVVIAAVLVIMTTALFIRSLGKSGRGLRWGSGIATVFIIGAFFNGLSFVDYNQDVSSMIMATCWLVAVAGVVIPLVRAQRVGTTRELAS